ncbi:MAG: DUF364 domain-containing protein [Clostridiales bacterium]|jgi:uncharacterized protein (DUF4213/DUF364 family)|nr:DUF364 domain-containing protein [Clostridiales bacterium]
MIIDELIQTALEGAGQRAVLDVRAGLGYTAVLLEGGACGLAYTFRDQLGESCGTLPEAGRLIGKKASEIIPWASSRNLLKAAIGMAAVNAVVNTPQTAGEAGNVMHALDIRPDTVFGSVGDFRPILSGVRKITDKIYVFERDVSGDDELYSEEAMPEHLPKCGVVVITASSLINHTADQVLSHCQNARQVCIVGPSAPLCPRVFRPYNVHLLAGSVVTDPQRVLEIVSQGGGTMSMKPAIRQVLVRV